MDAQPVTILVVDDTEAQRYAMARTLRNAGFQVEEAATGEQALAFAQRQPDLIILEVKLPDMLGYEVCRRLKSHPATASIPVVHVSADFVDNECRLHGLQDGADEYIVQPIHSDELVAKAKVWTRLRRAEIELQKKNADLSSALEGERLARERAEAAEAKLRDSNDLNREVTENSLDCIKVLDLCGRLTYMSNSGQRLLEIADLSRYLGRSWIDFWKGKDHHSAAEAVAVAKAGGTGRFQGFCASEKGTPKWWDVIVTPIRNDAGRVERLLSVSRDITAAKQAQEALRESEERFRVTQELSPDGFLIFRPLRDSTGTVTDFLWLYENDAAAQMNDTDPKDVCGKRVSEILPHHDESPFHKAYKEVAETSEVRVVEDAFYDRDSFRQRRWFRVVAVPTTGGDVAILVQDVTERKRAEEALRTQQELLHTVVTNIPAGVLMVRGKELRVAFVNPAYRAIAPGKEMVGQTIEELWPELHPGLSQLFRQVLETGEPHQAYDQLFEISRSSNGPTEMAYFTWSLFRVRLPGEDGWGILNTVWETTERKRAEEALIRSEKLASVGRMAATIAHEINNPLAAVVNELFLAQMNADSPQAVRQSLEVADAELRRVVQITRQALGFYRENTAPSPLCVNEIMDSAVDLLKNKIKAKHANVIKQYEGNLWVVGLAGELRQVFSNLLTNSLDAVEDKGTVAIRLSSGRAANNGHQCVRITIADNGKGIHPSARQRIFEPFFTTKESVGTGLGLWISKQIIEKHGGLLHFHSRTDELHRGTAFSLVLPAAAEDRYSAMAASALAAG